MTAIFNAAMKYENRWCDFMGYFNPYIDPFKYHLSSAVPAFDKKAHKQYLDHNFVYDKLWIVKSQNLPCGKLEDLFSEENNEPEEDSIVYPIFIKPRWGHLSASSKNCFKIQTTADLAPYKDYKEMMWSGFIDAKEGMTDYILLNGNIMHQITYIYSDKQHGFTDEWKFVSAESTPPEHITAWVEKHLRRFTGIVNVQHRGGKIIEVGLRLARGGAYVIAAQCPALIANINNIVTKQFWDFSLQNKLEFKPFYVFKCFTILPIVYIFPQRLLDVLVRAQTTRPFYEYYFEPAGKEGMVFLQFMADDLQQGLTIKRRIELLFNLTQLFFYLIIISTGICAIVGKCRWIYIFGAVLLWLTRYLNPVTANYNLYKAQKQLIFGDGPQTKRASPQEIETFQEDS